MATSANDLLSFTLRADTNDFNNQMSGSEKHAKKIERSISDTFKLMTNKSVDLLKFTDNKISELSKKSQSNFISNVKELNDLFNKNYIEFENNFPRFSKLINRFILPFQKVIDFSKEGIEAIKSFYEKLIGLSGNFLEVTKEKIKKYYEEVNKYVEKITGDIVKKFSSKFPIASKIIDVSLKMAKTTLSGLSMTFLGILSSTIKIGKSLKSWGEKGYTFFKKIYDTTGGLLIVTKKYYDNVSNAIKNTIKWTYKLSGLSLMVSGIKKAAKITFAMTGLTIAAAGIKGLFSTVKEGGNAAFGNLLGTLNAALLPVEDALFRLSVMMAPIIVKVLQPFITLAISAVESLTKMMSNMNQEGSILGKIFGEIQKIAMFMIETITEIGNLLVKDLLPELGPIFVMIFDELTGLVRVIMPVIIDLVKTLFPIIGQVLRIIAPLLGDLFKALSSIFKEVVASIKDILPEVVKFLEESIPKLVPAFKSLVNAVVNLAKILAPLFSTIIKFMVVFIGKVFGPIILGLLEVGITLIADMIQAFVDMASYLKNNWGPSISSFFSGVWKIVLGGVDFFNDYVIGSFKGVISAIQYAWNGMMNFFTFDSEQSSFWSVILKVFNAAIGKVTGWIDWIIDNFNYYIADTTLGRYLGMPKLPTIGDGSQPPPSAIKGSVSSTEIIQPNNEVAKQVIEAKIQDRIKLEEGKAMLSEMSMMNKNLVKIIEAGGQGRSVMNGGYVPRNLGLMGD